MYLKTIVACLILSFNLEETETLILKQVVILSRHNVRTPLSKTHGQISPKPWPKWKEKRGYLTAKGELLEGFMGEYFSSWLNEQGILPEGCPSEENFYVYANTKQRTLASAKSFVKSGFPNCNIIVHHANKYDPIFKSDVHNSSAVFIREAVATMTERIKTLQLNKSYELMEEILDYKNSVNCIKKHQCDLVTGVNEPIVKTGSKPILVGPLQISKSAFDSFLMQNYEGFNTNNVAWGGLKTEQTWQAIMDLSRTYHSVVFNSTVIAKDLSVNLIKYLTKYFLEQSPKVTLIIGHDENLYTVLIAMGFEPYVLEKQYEITPIGGKLVFQKWVDNNTREFLKVDYVYQSTEQMRYGVRLSFDNPPIFKRLRLKDCKIDQNGLCPWDDFVRILNSL